MTRLYYILVFGCIAFTANSASITDNLVSDSPRIHNGDELVSSIVNDCFDGETMKCLKGKVLTYLDTLLNLKEDSGRSSKKSDVDEMIFDRMSRVLAKNELRYQLPEFLFNKAVLSYRSDRGLDIDIPKARAEEARGDLIKKKLLLPVLLLLKLKLKALMPIFVAIIGFKALKALILSKLAISLVLGFVIYQLVKKTGLGAPMAMAPMSPESPMTAYAAPTTSSPSSYDPSSWEPASGGPYSRVWEPSAAQSMAYSAYYPSGTSSSSSSGSGSSSSTGTSHSSYSS